MSDATRQHYDLHSHSSYSDGSYSVRELIDQARRAGLDGMAITDHDCLLQLSAVRAVAREERFPVLAGVEVSAFDSKTGRKVHVLGFGLEATSDASGPLERIVAETLARRAANTLWQAWVIERVLGRREAVVPSACAGVIDTGFSVGTAVAVARESTAVYKQHVMDALCHLPYSSEAYQVLYRSLFKGEGVACRDISYPEATDVVRAIREQGGHPVLAHPGQMDSWSAIPELVQAGLEGVEVHHPDHTVEHVAMARAAAAAHGLFCTGGSDFHGSYGAPEALGCCSITVEEAGDRVAALFARERMLG